TTIGSVELVHALEHRAFLVGAQVAVHDPAATRVITEAHGDLAAVLEHHPSWIFSWHAKNRFSEYRVAVGPEGQYIHEFSLGDLVVSIPSQQKEIVFTGNRDQRGI